VSHVHLCFSNSIMPHKSKRPTSFIKTSALVGLLLVSDRQSEIPDS
jgi:hypothetical protein